MIALLDRFDAASNRSCGSPSGSACVMAVWSTTTKQSTVAAFTDELPDIHDVAAHEALSACEIQLIATNRSARSEHRARRLASANNSTRGWLACNVFRFF